MPTQARSYEDILKSQPIRIIHIHHLDQCKEVQASSIGNACDYRYTLVVPGVRYASVLVQGV